MKPYLSTGSAVFPREISQAGLTHYIRVRFRRETQNMGSAAFSAVLNSAAFSSII